ncbi:MAG: chorismate synthase [Elusimicrobia bacterium]|nr:chorismate synthase [Elusimicrobiota bacterium]
MRLRFLTAGESHGPALLGIIEGLPAGLKLGAADFERQLARRRLGLGRGARQALEADRVETLCGLRGGRTTGAPVALLIRNADFDPVMAAVTVPRPGHADLPGARKYRTPDVRDVAERSSARETAMRTALSAAARRLLETCGIALGSRTLSIGGVVDGSTWTGPVRRLNAQADASPVRAIGGTASRRMTAALARARARGDSLGGTFEIRADGLPPGLGSCAHWDRRLDGRLGGALMSLGGVKAVAVGLGWAAPGLPGSKAHDAFAWKGGRAAYRSNRSGGIDGGMTTGEPLILRAAMKPIPTLARPLPSVDLAGRRPAAAPTPRADVCAVAAAAVIGEAVTALVLAEALLEKTGGDSMKEILPRLRQLRRLPF